jgi:pimeloyl-ACP methyl ester carboxylesterase
MKKNWLVIFEIIIYIGVILIFNFFLNDIYVSIRGYKNYFNSMPLDFIIIYKTLLYFIPILILIILFKLIINKQKKTGINGIYRLIKKILKPHKLVSILVIIVSIVLLFSYTIINIHDLFIYFPTDAPGAENIVRYEGIYEKINIISDDGNQYNGWALIDESNTETIIYYGGNAQLSAVFFMNQNELKWRDYQGFNFVMVDYPGYGLSSGIPNENDINKMSLSVYDYVSKMKYVDSSKIVVMGFSLGTGVASYVGSQRNVYKLILVSPYTSLIDVFNARFPVFYGPFELLIKSKFKTIERIENIDSDVLIIYSLNDEVLPYRFSKQVVDKGKNIESLVLEEESHNNILNNESVFIKISEFIR